MSIFWSISSNWQDFEIFRNQNFRKLFIKNIGCIKQPRTLYVCVLQATFTLSSERSNAWKWSYDKHYEPEFTLLNIVWVGNILDGFFWITIIRVGIFQVGVILAGSYPGWEFSRWELSWLGIFRVGVILAGNCPGWSYPGWEFSLVGVLRVGFSGGNHPGGNFPGGSFPSTYSANR